MCVVALAGCTNKEKPKQYVAELSNPYVNTLPSLNKELDISYQFQNNLTQVGDYMTVGYLKITVYNEENIVIGHEVIDAQYWFHHKMELGEQDAILGKTKMKLRWAPKDGEKLRIVGETFIGIEDGFTLSNTVEYTVHREK